MIRFCGEVCRMIDESYSCQISFIVAVNVGAGGHFKFVQNYENSYKTILKIQFEEKFRIARTRKTTPV